MTRVMKSMRRGSLGIPVARRRGSGLIGLLLIAALWLGPVADLSADQGADPSAETAGHHEPEQTRELEEAADPSAPHAAETESSEDGIPVPYVPPSRGRAVNTAAGGTRTLTTEAGHVSVAVLAPRDHVALTTRAQPTLYWFVSGDTDQRIDITLVDEDSIDPLLEMTVPSPIREGIHALVLAELGLSLEPLKTYRWHVAIVQDAKRRSVDTLAEGFIERMGMSASLERSLRDARYSFAPYALSGIWYDAMDEVLSAIDADPKNKRLRLQRAALLEQAELGMVATYALRAER